MSCPSTPDSSNASTSDAFTKWGRVVQPVDLRDRVISCVEPLAGDVLNFADSQQIFLDLLQSPDGAAVKISALSEAMKGDERRAAFLAHWLLLLSEDAHRLTANSYVEYTNGIPFSETMDDLMAAAEQLNILQDGDIFDFITVALACSADSAGLETPVSLLGDLGAPECLHRVLTALALVRLDVLANELGVLPVEALRLTLEEG